MESTPTRCYDKTVVRGNARLLQGDQDNSTNYKFDHVNTVQIYLGSALEGTQITSGNSSSCHIVREGHICQRIIYRERNTDLDESKHDSSDGTRNEVLLPTSISDLQQRKLNTQYFNTPLSTHQNGHGAAIVNTILKAIGSHDEAIHLPLSDEVVQQISGADSLDQLQSTLVRSSPRTGYFILSAIDHIRRNSCFPSMIGLLPAPRQSTSSPLHELAGLTEPAKELVTMPTSGHAMQDLVATFCALLALLACGTTPNTDTTTTNSIKQMQKLPLLAGLIAFAAARYVCFPLLGKALSELSGDYIVIEDAFRIDRKVPMSHCQHFKMLEAFLGVNLAGTTAEAFINAKQFNLSLGKRGGLAIRSSDWSAKGVIRPKSRVVMSVYLKRGDAKCIDCQANLEMSPEGQFAWYA